MVASSCAFRKSYPNVMVVQPRQDWDGNNNPGSVALAYLRFVSISMLRARFDAHAAWFARQGLSCTQSSEGPRKRAQCSNEPYRSHPGSVNCTREVARLVRRPISASERQIQQCGHLGDGTHRHSACHNPGISGIPVDPSFITLAQSGKPSIDTARPYGRVNPLLDKDQIASWPNLFAVVVDGD